jgi:1-acyl-sn-glycerol-3-phosphate acyltransferase
MRSYIYFVISIPVYALLYLNTAITVLLCIFFSYLNMKKTVKGCIRIWAKGSFLLIGRKLRIHGIENFDKNKKYILLANHSSLFDIMAIMAFHPGVSWFGRERLIKIPVFGRLLKSIDYIPMKTANIKNTKEMLDQLVQNSKGVTIAIFPEGTRTIDGTINNFRRGFIHVLRASELEILPVTLKGFYELKPKNRFHIKFNTKINVFIHKPIKNNYLIEKDDQEIISTVREVIASAYY